MHEIDLIVKPPDGAVTAVEIKLGAVVGDADVKHLHWLRGRARGPIAGRGRHLDRTDRLPASPDGVAVVPAGLLGA